MNIAENMQRRIAPLRLCVAMAEQGRGEIFVTPPFMAGIKGRQIFASQAEKLLEAQCHSDAMQKGN